MVEIVENDDEKEGWVGVVIMRGDYNGESVVVLVLFVAFLMLLVGYRLVDIWHMFLRC